MDTPIFSIQKHIFSLKKGSSITLQLNIIKWSENSPKYDIRTWKDEKPGKGVTLDLLDLKTLSKLLESNIALFEDFSTQIPKEIGTPSFSCKLYQSCGNIGDLDNWHLELNVISWKNSACKFDLRKWDKDKKHGKGVTLSHDEAAKLLVAIKSEIQEAHQDQGALPTEKELEAWTEILTKN